MGSLKGKRCLKVLIALVAISIASSGFAKDEEQPQQDAVAVVNGAVISQTDFDMQMARIQEQLRRSGKPPSSEELAEIGKGVLDDLIARELIYQETIKKGIKADPEAVNKQFDALKGRFSSEEEFTKALSRVNMSEAIIRSQMEREVTINQFIEREFIQKVSVSDKETKSFYDSHQDSFKQPEQMRASHILIKVEPQADEAKKAEARKKIDMIQGKLKKGEDFGALAKEYSEGPSSDRGGDLGSFSRGQMVKPFEDAAFALKPGEVSGIVETKFGYHLIKVEDKTPETIVAYAEAKERIGQYLKNVEAQKEIGLYVENLRKNAKVEVYSKKE
jgi:peptidyl-prolyl cis-trans isomerase C